MGSNGSSGGGSSSRERAVTRQYTGPSGTTGKEKSFGEKVGETVKTVVSNLPTVKAVTAISKAVRRGRVNTSLMGTPDYQGSTTRSNVGTTERGGDGGGAMGTSGQVVQAPQPMVAPTTAEVSQVTTTDAEDPLLLRKRKTLARGRSLTIQTGPTGATGSLTLGKPSLLGR